jgi:hypothetical protein
MKKVNWLTASASLRVGGAALHWSFFFAVGVQFANCSSQLEASVSGRRNLSNTGV